MEIDMPMFVLSNPAIPRLKPETGHHKKSDSIESFIPTKKNSCINIPSIDKIPLCNSRNNPTKRQQRTDYSIQT